MAKQPKAFASKFLNPKVLRKNRHKDKSQKFLLPLQFLNSSSARVHASELVCHLSEEAFKRISVPVRHE